MPTTNRGRRGEKGRARTTLPRLSPPLPAVLEKYLRYIRRATSRAIWAWRGGHYRRKIAGQRRQRDKRGANDSAPRTLAAHRTPGRRATDVHSQAPATCHAIQLLVASATLPPLCVCLLLLVACCLLAYCKRASLTTAPSAVRRRRRAARDATSRVLAISRHYCDCFFGSPSLRHRANYCPPHYQFSSTAITRAPSAATSIGIIMRASANVKREGGRRELRQTRNNNALWHLASSCQRYALEHALSYLAVRQAV